MVKIILLYLQYIRLFWERLPVDDNKIYHHAPYLSYFGEVVTSQF